ncbi:hypothetical protein AB0G00_23735 [Nocardia salmonicida]|uniref:hypothetical protein n=1 Tax=Nocardia salmonicida TaxID=53431 RepID=UPI00340C170E
MSNTTAYHAVLNFANAYGLELHKKDGGEFVGMVWTNGPRSDRERLFVFIAVNGDVTDTFGNPVSAMLAGKKLFDFELMRG